ncbi:MAG: zinc-binding alcohol dehydrogenase [Roseomonas sp.]|nr:zinc-binding alcohol dehydrogenase [Roseomonas sp.]MCA3390693.1 zinc-binding alcohol dehydrogenase [Roseomonas sp.]MCA3409163.1 zinc-binding alcohol dehydrogenase [Roseomonas sp.]
MTKARALWTIAPGVAELRTETLPARAPDQVLARMLASGISRGTERLVLAGKVPENQWGVMRCPLQAGDFPFPVKYGYSGVARVIEGPADLQGRRVFCLHPHQDVFLAPASMCIAIPDAVPDTRAVLGANMETALNILWDAEPLAGERALVIGAGVVGLLVAYLLARIPAMTVTIIDPDPSRRAIAEHFGVAFAAPEAAPGDQELIIHASANPAGLRQALHCAAFEARIIEASWFGAQDVALPLGEAFHSRRLRLISSQVGAVAPAMRGRRSFGERMAQALGLLADPALEALIGPATSFDDLPQAMPSLLNPAPGMPAPLCPLVTYGA